uniref:Izumo sperm-egg fusion protein 4 n=1 Tax=Salvator merianae TaxID=96440 RepID=A0A8D0B6F5_SALMN
MAGPGPCLALIVALVLGPLPSRPCLQCDPNFAIRFASFAPNLSRKSWGLGDVPAAGRRLRGWVEDTLQELNLGVPPDIPMAKLQKIASIVYEKLDTLFKGNTYKPGKYGPTYIHNKEGLFGAENPVHRLFFFLGINQYEAISCQTCNVTKLTCFGYNCE